MRRPVTIGLFLVLLLPAWTRAPRAAAAGQPAKVKLGTGMAVWDTGRPSPAVVEAAALAGKNDWTALPPGKPAASFQGDAILSNGRVVAVFRKQDSAVEVHAVKPDGVAARLRRMCSAP